MRRLFLGLVVIGLLCFPPVALARLGVGVGIGKIQVDQILKPGMIYELPPLTVLNTGDEVADYEVIVSHHQDQKQIIPAQEWFSFSPATFQLNPGKVQAVAVKLNLPLKIAPGDYFAYLEAHPTKKAGGGSTTVGVAAAAKLYFTVAPANAILGIYYRAASFWKAYQPWSTRLLGVLAVLLAAVLFRRFFRVQLRTEKKKQEQNG